MGPRVASKIPSRSPRLRAKPEARGLRDGIFVATQGPIWYFYYLIVHFMKNICKNNFDIKWHQKLALEISFLQI